MTPRLSSILEKEPTHPFEIPMTTNPNISLVSEKHRNCLSNLHVG